MKQRKDQSTQRQGRGICPIRGEKRLEKMEDGLRDNIKQTNIHIIGVPEGEERERKGQKFYLRK